MFDFLVCGTYRDFGEGSKDHFQNTSPSRETLKMSSLRHKIETLSSSVVRGVGVFVKICE